MSSLVIAAGDLGNVQSKVTSALQAIQGLLTAIVVIVGIVVALAIIIKRLPSADDRVNRDAHRHSTNNVPEPASPLHRNPIGRERIWY